MPDKLTSRTFMNGNSQAVRIPQAFRLDTQQVSITRTANGELLICPLPESPQQRASAILSALQDFGDLGQPCLDEFVSLLEEDRKQQQPDQEREAF